MKQKIKSALFAALTLGLVAATAVAYTWAISGSEADFNNKENTFTNGSIAAELSEVGWTGTKGTNDTDGDIPDSALQGKNAAKNYTATSVINKNPKMTNTSTLNKAEYVAIHADYYAIINGETYYYTRSQFESNIAQLCTGTTSTPSVGINSNWEASTDGDMFYYKAKLAQGASTERLFDVVKINMTASGGVYTINTYTAAGVTTPNPSGSEVPKTTTNLPEFHIILKGYAVDAKDFGDNYGTKKTEIQDALNSLTSLSTSNS